MPHAEQVLPAEAASVRLARRFAADRLAGWGADELRLAALQVVSELATNATLHARTGYRLELTLEDGGDLLIGVVDSSPRQPVRRTYGVEASTGRGLALVAALASETGVTLVPAGKRVWARLSADGLSGDGEDLEAFDVHGLIAEGLDTGWSQSATASGLAAGRPDQRSGRDLDGGSRAA